MDARTIDTLGDEERADRERLGAMLDDAHTPAFQQAMLTNSKGLTTIIGPLSLDAVMAGKHGDDRRVVEIMATAVRIAFWFGLKRGEYIGRWKR